MRSSFLDYAMSVIVSRALPDVRDGLKPVHRRVLWGMHDAGMQPNRPYKKSASIVGDVMGSYHPHGDQAIYDTLVRMAQPFSLRYPLVDGQGNFGSLDDDPPAAMRYTECRLTKLATEMLRDIDMDTVDFGPNYDESRKEPLAMPSRFPNLLVNGSSGIAVGMATNMPPHNLGEAIDAVVQLIDKPEANVDDLMKHLSGPDFPTGAIIVGRSGIRDAYRTGPRPHRHARPRPHRGAARRQERDRRHRAAVRRQEGRRQRRDQEDRRPRQREGDHRGLGSRRPLRPLRDADPDRAQARRDPAGGAEQALQAHGAAVDVRLQRRRARRRRAARDVAARDRAPLPRLPARGRDPPLEVRAAPEREARARPPRLPDRARQPRRRDRPDPRLRRHRLGPPGPDERTSASPRSRRRRSSTSASHGSPASPARRSRPSTPTCRSGSPSCARSSATRPGSTR